MSRAVSPIAAATRVASIGGLEYRNVEAPRLGLILDGLVRVFPTSPEGRQLTVRYGRPGGVLGVPTAIGGPVDVSVQALTETAVLMLDINAVRSIAKRSPDVAWALAEEVTCRLYEVLEAFSGNVFGSVRQRVARHLRAFGTDFILTIQDTTRTDVRESLLSRARPR